MNVAATVFVGWALLLMGLSFGCALPTLNDLRNETRRQAGEERQCPRVFPDEPRNFQVRHILAGALGRKKLEVNCLYTYGCWCGLRGEGSSRYVDSIDFCCKVHDFCEAELDKSKDRCAFRNKERYMRKRFKYDKETMKCASLDAYTDTSNRNEKKCRRAVCLCDMELIRCIKHYNDEINFDNMNNQQCTVPARAFCKTKADVVVLIQHSEGIDATIAGRVKTVVRRLLNLLGSERRDYNFALATYGTTRRMSCFGSATDTISYMDREYQHGGTGHNLLKLALSEMILEQFDKRRDDRKDDNTAKVLVIFSDGNAEDESGDIMDTFWLEKIAKQLREDNNINIVGALIPNTRNTQRIQELKSIVSQPEDAINAEFSAAQDDLNDIADRLTALVKPLVCRVKYTVKVYTPESFVKSEYKLTVRIQGEGGQNTAHHVLKHTTQETEGGLQVIKSEFLDVDVGNMDRIEILTQRAANGDRGWTLKEIKVEKGQETVTAVFRKRIPSDWQGRLYSAKAWRNPYVEYTVEIYGSPDTSADNLFLSLSVRLMGNDQDTKTQVLTTRTKEIQGDLLVITAHFTDVDVGPIERIWIEPQTRRDWTLNKVIVKTERETVTGEFNEEFAAWAVNHSIAPARASNPPNRE